MSKLPTVGLPSAVGIPVKLLKHDGKNWRVISVPKSAVPEPLLHAARRVVLLLATPQHGTFAIEARKWQEKAHHIYFVTKKPYLDFVNHLAEQGTRTLLLYQILPAP